MAATMSASAKRRGFANVGLVLGSIDAFATAVAGSLVFDVSLLDEHHLDLAAARDGAMLDPLEHGPRSFTVTTAF